jgi:hypothetical protein
VDSVPGKGSTFSMWLNVWKEERDRHSSERGTMI